MAPRPKTIADGLLEFYCSYEGSPNSRPTVILRDDEIGGSEEKSGLLRTIGEEMSIKTVPEKYKSVRGCGSLCFEYQIVAENVLADKPSYKLRINIANRPEGGHHC